MPKPSGAFGGFVEIDLVPLANNDHCKAQRISVRTNGTPAGSTALGLPAVVGFPFQPPRSLDRHFIVTIQHPDAYSQGTPDDPQFALAVRSVRIINLEEPFSKPCSRISHRIIPSDNDTTDKSKIIAALEKIVEVPIHDFLTRFQLIAGDCEFGGVQRRCGSEPLSLFRFAGASPQSAIHALDCNFEGIGQSLEPYIAEHGDREWMMKDLRYHLGYHTGMSSMTVSRERVIASEQKKVAFLRRKFLEDLQTHETIFVCADRFASPPEAMIPLFLALNRHGPNTLLWITTAEIAEDVGRVEEVRPRLMRGYIDRFLPLQAGQDPSIMGWLTVLLNGFLLSRTRSGG